MSRSQARRGRDHALASTLAPASGRFLPGNEPRNRHAHRLKLSLPPPAERVPSTRSVGGRPAPASSIHGTSRTPSASSISVTRHACALVLQPLRVDVGKGNKGVCARAAQHWNCFLRCRSMQVFARVD